MREAEATAARSAAVREGGRAAGRSRWDVVALGVAAGVMIGIAVGKVPPAMAVISADFGLDKVTTGWLASIFFAFGAASSVLTGMTGGRVGERSLLLIGLAVLALGGALGAASTSGSMLLALRVIEGIGFATITVAVPKLVVDATGPRDRDLALGIWSTYMPVGMAIAMVVTPFLLPALGWRGVWLIGAGATAGVALWAFVGTTQRRWPDQPRRDPAAGFDWAGVCATLPRGVLWLYAGTFVLFTVQWFAVAAWLPTFLTETQGRSALTAALFSALVVGTNAIGNLSGAWLLHHGAPRWTLIAGANVIMGVTGALVLAGFMPEDSKIPIAIIFSMGSGVLPAAGFSGAAQHAPKPQLIAMASGFIMQGAAIGMLAGPPLLAAVVSGFGGWEAAWWTMLICPAISLCLTMGILRRERGRLRE